LKRGSLTIAASQTIANYWLPGRVQAFHTAHPGIDLHVTMANTEQVARAVGLDPVASRAGSGAFMSGGQDLVRDSLSGHPRRIAGGPSPADSSSDAPL